MSRDLQGSGVFPIWIVVSALFFTLMIPSPVSFAEVKPAGKKPTQTLFLHTLQFSRTIGVAGSSAPVGVAHAPDGSWYVVDSAQHRILHFTAAGNVDALWGKQGNGPCEFYLPMCAAVAADGSLYVTDSGNFRVQHLSAKGEFLGQWGIQGGDPGFSPVAAGIAVAPNGTVWVVVGNAHRILVFSATGNFLRAVEQISANPGSFKWPGHIAISPFGEVAISDVGNNRVVVLDETGRTIRCLDAESAQVSGFSPRGLAWTAAGLLYVAERTSGRVLGFDTQFKPLGELFPPNPDLDMLKAEGLSISTTGTLLAVDAGAGACKRFQFSTLSSGGRKSDVYGSVEGVAREDIDHVRVVLLGTLGKSGFWTTSGLDSTGRFTLNKLPNKAKFSITLTFDRTKYSIRRAEVRGTVSPDTEPIRFVLREK